MVKLLLLLLALAITTAKESKSHPNLVALGGKPASIGVFPWHVSIWKHVHRICDGTIVGPKWVLTSADCLEGYNTSASSAFVVGGTSELKPIGTTYRVSSIHKSETVALLKLESEITWTDPLPIAGPEDVSTTCTLSGWLEGINSLQYVDMVPAKDEDCKSKWGETYNSTSNAMCAATPSENLGVCIGRLGAPLVCNGKQAGILLLYSIPDDVYRPCLFVKLSPYLSWIEKLEKES